MTSPTDQTSHEPVAIVGLGCRWAGGVKSPADLWELLRNKRDGWQKFDQPHFSANGFHHENKDRSGTVSTEGGFLVDEDARLFDNAFFGITNKEVETMDPSQRKLLEVVYEAFENAGETWDSISGSRTGVYIGNFAFDHLLIQSRDWEYTKPYAATGADTSILANRISYIFNLHGPSVATNTACSSSMYALHIAMSAIRNGDCDGAIVAAGNWISDPSMQLVLDKLGALSPSSRCHTFDAAADGYARGEGFAALYLKKTSVALLEKLPIRAMIRGTAVNANGRTGGITRPSAASQEDVIRKAYENAGDLPLADTTFFECHGTGTQAGDPLEVSAVGNVFAPVRSDNPEDYLLIGSIKPNLGHTEGASAIASIMKVVLAIENGEIAPTAGITELNPNIDFQKARVSVLKDKTIPWPTGKLRRASVNSFGFGGANGHCIIDHVENVLPEYTKPGVTDGSRRGSNASSGGSWPEVEAGTAKSNHIQLRGVRTPPSTPPNDMHVISAVKKASSNRATSRQLVLLPFSAHSATSLGANIAALSRVIDEKSLADVAYTLGDRRSKLQQRSFRVVSQEKPSLALTDEGPVFGSSLENPGIAFVFTGQGAQWHGMGTQLFDYAIFRSRISYLDYILSQLTDSPSWDIASSLSGRYEPNHIQLSEVSQVVCTAVQIGLVDTLASWSIQPTAVTGHSSGEIAASYASGHLTAAEAIVAAYLRGQAVSRNTRKGAMLAVGIGADQIAPYLEGRESSVKIAAINSPRSVTLSGDEDAIKEVSAKLSSEDIFNRQLRTAGNAYHSHHMVAIGKDYITLLDEGFQRLRELDLIDEHQRYARIRWHSSVDPERIMAEGETTAAYWRANLESPVRFSDALAQLLSAEGHRTADILLEIGPHAALKGPINQILQTIGKSALYVPSLIRGSDGRQDILELAGTLWAHNATVDVAAVNSTDGGVDCDNYIFEHGCVTADLPTYKFTYGPVNYYESRISKDFRLRSVPRHDLLGSKVPGSNKLQPQWRNILRAKELPWLCDHRLIPDIVFPAAGFIAMAVEGATRINDESTRPAQVIGYTLRKVDIDTALRVPEDDSGVEVILNMHLSGEITNAWARFTITSVTPDSEEWTRHCTGLIKLESKETKVEVRYSTATDPRSPEAQSWYRKFKDIGLGYGPSFQSLSAIRADPRSNIASAAVAMHTTTDMVEGQESRYAIHPAALDATFQMAIIAIYGGQVEQARSGLVPVHFSQLHIKPTSAFSSATAIAQGSMQGLRSAYASLQMLDESGHVFVDVKSLRLTSFREMKTHSDSSTGKQFNSPFSRLTWKPDIRDLDDTQIRSLFPPIEDSTVTTALETVDMICCLVIAEVYHTYLSGGRQVIPKGDIKTWLAWVRRCVEVDERANMTEARNLTTPERRQRLTQLFEEYAHKPETRAAKCLLKNMNEIISETKSGIECLISENLLTPLYETGHVIAGSHPQLFNIMDSLGHVNPNMKILEIGAGTGAATRVAMQALSSPNGTKRYADYTFTDISAGFLSNAKEMLSAQHDISYKVLDIEKPPLENGLEPVYDVVIACEAIHATTSMDVTLKHCQDLLKPGGKLVLVETTGMRVLLGLLYGTLSGYWRPDGRTEGPFMDIPTWDARLRKNNFSGVELHLDDYCSPHATTSVLVSTRGPNPALDTALRSPVGEGREIYLVHDGFGLTPMMQQLMSELRARRNVVRNVTLNFATDSIPAQSNIIALFEDANVLVDANDRSFKAIQHLARSCRSMVWLVSGNILKGENPQSALMGGLLRVIATENPSSRFLSINVEGRGFDTANSKLAQAIADKENTLQADSDRDASIDTEYVWQNGCLWVSRVVPDDSLREYSTETQAPLQARIQSGGIDSQGAVRAAFETSGIVTSLYFRPYTGLLQPLPDDFIDVKIAAVGLNWKDLALTTGGFNAASSNLSSEYAGIITGLGTGVRDFAVGDRVYGIGRGQFGNFTRVPAAFVQKLGPDHSFEDAATLPLVMMTAVYAFTHVARLRRGQNVLIQSATGGLGLAAIQVAQMQGANIFVTAGTPEKASFLATHAAIPASHVIMSRDNDALSKAAKKLKRGGFDIILSTVTGGDLLAETLTALAPMGHLIDVGRVDVLEAKDLGLEVFQRNASFTSFDLNVVLDSDPELGAELMRTVRELHHSGAITSIHPSIVSDVSELPQTLLGFSRGTHIGKNVISFQNPNAQVRMLQEPPKAALDAQACYVIAGGLGGLGRSIVSWMIDHGALHIIILSRRDAGSAAFKELTAGFKCHGLRIEARRCDISNREEVDQAISAIRKSYPVKGVVNAGLQMSDLSFDKLTLQQWRTGLAAKVNGSINLHEATLVDSLEFFVMITTTETIWSPPTQGTYIAANNFQEYFARHRRSLGLPASTVSYGLVSEIGSDFRDTSHGTEDMYVRNMASTISEYEMLAAFEIAILNLQEAPGISAQRHDPLSGTTLFTCLNPTDLAQMSSSITPRWHKDARVSLVLRAIEDCRRLAASKGLSDEQSGLENASSATHTRIAFEEAIKQGASARESTTTFTTSAIVRAIADMLFIDTDTINPLKSVAEHGVDSLIAAELRHWFHEALETDLRMQDLLDASTNIKTLAQSIVDKGLKTE